MGAEKPIRNRLTHRIGTTRAGRGPEVVAPPPRGQRWALQLPPTPAIQTTEPGPVEVAFQEEPSPAVSAVPHRLTPLDALKDSPNQ